jgi:4-diphosphocytidyl-2-C-methyl-D-erythritol kinase
MISFPNCKINLGLHIIRKRIDGYHDLETVFYPLPVKDVLEVIQKETGDAPVDLVTSGLPVDGEATDNLCVKAWHLLKRDFPQLPPVRMHLHKVIPMGAGLGGGSSDASETLLLLDTIFNLGLSRTQLSAYALELGSDCPFFLLNSPCFARGRGEMLEEIALDLSQYSFVLVNPAIHINTGWAFSSIIPRDLRPGTASASLKEIIQLPISDWKDHLVNDFEQPVFSLYPEIKAVSDSLYAHGALYSAMTGSGSTVFGIFDKPVKPVYAAHYTVITC